MYIFCQLHQPLNNGFPSALLSIDTQAEEKRNAFLLYFNILYDKKWGALFAGYHHKYIRAMLFRFVNKENCISLL